MSIIIVVITVISTITTTKTIIVIITGSCHHAGHWATAGVVARGRNSWSTHALFGTGRRPSAMTPRGRGGEEDGGEGVKGMEEEG